jgi:hypothetical protein
MDEKIQVLGLQLNNFWAISAVDSAEGKLT